MSNKIYLKISKSFFEFFYFEVNYGVRNNFIIIEECINNFFNNTPHNNNYLNSLLINK
jgi:hypothetical protein